MKAFLQQAAGKAHDFTMTGSKFPLETELVYSSDSDGGIVDEVNSPASAEMQGQKGTSTMKS